jgi:general stress protein YciG
LKTLRGYAARSTSKAANVLQDQLAHDPLHVEANIGAEGGADSGGLEVSDRRG